MGRVSGAVQRPVISYTASMATGVPVPFIGVSTTLQAFGISNVPMRSQGEVGVFEGLIRVRTNAVMHFMDETASSIPSSLAKVITAGKQVMVTFQPANLAGILAGTYDNNIKLWARTLAGLGGKGALLRFAHEMNTTAYPYGSAYGSANYIALWNYVRNVWRTEETANGLAHVPWMWCPNVSGGGANPFSAYYPGNSACEFVGLDGYSFAASGYPSFSTTFDADLTTLQSLSTKDIIIGETGSPNTNVGRPAWITGMFTYLQTRPRVKGVMFWHHDVGGYMLTDPASAEAYRLGLAAWAPGVT